MKPMTKRELKLSEEISRLRKENEQLIKAKYLLEEELRAERNAQHAMARQRSFGTAFRGMN